MRFWIPWGFDAAISSVVLYFFFAGLADGSVSSFNIGLWTGILLALGAILGGSFWLRSAGHRRAAMGLLLLLAIPGVLAILFLFVVLISRPRWN